MANRKPVQKRIDPSRTPTKGGRPGGKKPRVVVRKATFGDWVGGARIRTLPLAVAPVALGSGAAFLLSEPGWHWVRILLCLAVAVGLLAWYSRDRSPRAAEPSDPPTS